MAPQCQQEDRCAHENSLPASRAERVDRKDEIFELKAKYEEELASAITASQKSTDGAQKEVQNYRENIDATVRRAYEAKFSKTKKRFEDVRARLEA
jgi:serologically defined colon cancer antigen 8